MAKLTEYPRITKMKDNDILLVDGPDGTRTILQADASKQMGGEVIMVNETAGDSTKVVINTTNEEIELATMDDLEAVEEDVGELKTQLITNEILDYNVDAEESVEETTTVNSIQNYWLTPSVNFKAGDKWTVDIVLDSVTWYSGASYYMIISTTIGESTYGSNQVDLVQNYNVPVTGNHITIPFECTGNATKLRVCFYFGAGSQKAYIKLIRGTGWSSPIQKDLQDLTDSVDELSDSIENANRLVDYNSKYTKTDETQEIIWTDNKIYGTRGAITDYEGRSISQKIDCASKTFVTIIGSAGSVTFWNDNNDYISQRSMASTTLFYMRVPANAAFVGVTIITENKASVVVTLEKGESKLITETYNAPAKLLCNRSNFRDLTRAATNGAISTGAENVCCALYIKCEPNHKYRANRQQEIIFYNDDGEVISSIIPEYNNISEWNVPIEMDFETPANCEFMSVNSIMNNDAFIYDIEDIDIVGKSYYKLLGKNVVCFGDSITGNYGYGSNYPERIETLTGAKTYNVGFGGTRAELVDTATDGSNVLALCALVDEIIKDDSDATKWDAQDSVAESKIADSTNRNWYYRLQILKNINFSTIDYVTFAYGTNEIGLPQDDEQNPENTHTYAGALRYAVKKLLGAYPHIRIMFITPCYRYYSGSIATNDLVDGDSEAHPLYKNVDTMISVAEELRIPVANVYYELGIDKYNYESFFEMSEGTVTDGTHPKEYGRQIIGNFVAGKMNEVF